VKAFIGAAHNSFGLAVIPLFFTSSQTSATYSRFTALHFDYSVSILKAVILPTTCPFTPAQIVFV